MSPDESAPATTPAPTTPATPVRPVGVNHLVLNVTDLERSHQFWTDVMGFQQVGDLAPPANAKRPMQMRFYAGRGGNHHDLALMQIPDAEPAEAERWSTRAKQPGLNHVAVEYGDQESWLAQLRCLQAAGIPFRSRINHGMSHSVYIQDPDGHGIEVIYTLPPEQWQNDINAALNYMDILPREGADALADPETPVFE